MKSVKAHQLLASIRTRPLLVVLVVVGLVLVVWGATLLTMRYLVTHGSAELPDPKQTIVSDVPEPSEKKPATATGGKYEVPADQPRSIRISSLAVDGLLQRVGRTSDNRVAAPTNVYFGGWYTKSVAPGQPGLSIIDGHVSGEYADGIFKRLGDIKKGDRIEIEMGDGTIHAYRAVDTKSLPAAEAGTYLFTKRADIIAQLNLITCDGQFNRTTETYDDRIVVVAERM